MGSNDNNAHRRRSTLAALVLTGTIAMAACGSGGDDDSAAMEMSVEEAARSGADESAADSAGGDSFIESTSEGGIDTDRDGGFDIGVIGRDVIVEMRVVVSSDNIQRSVASIMASASSLGGGIASSDVNYGSGSDNDGYAVLVVKVPPQSVDRLLSGLDDTGVVQSISQSAQDVTEQLVNLDVRIDNARQSVENVRGFMETTTNLKELVSLEAELTRRQTELEQLEAQQRNISDRVALSTVTIEVIRTADVPEPIVEVEQEDESIGDAFRSGWKAFATLLFGIAFVLAATLPFLLLGLLVATIVWAVIRRRDHGAEPAMSAPSQSNPTPTPDIAPDDATDTATDEVREPEAAG